MALQPNDLPEKQPNTQNFSEDMTDIFLWITDIGILIGVRLRVEQNQLVVVCWRFGSRVIELQGA
jgi:hypothetical protein